MHMTEEATTKTQQQKEPVEVAHPYKEVTKGQVESLIWTETYVSIYERK